MNNNDKQFIAQKIRTQYMEKESTELDELRALAEDPTTDPQAIEAKLMEIVPTFRRLKLPPEAPAGDEAK